MIYTVTLNTSIDRTIEVENFKPANVNQGRLIHTLPAGKGMNVSRILSMLGSTSTATGFVGKKELSSYRESAEGTLIDVDFAALDAPTRENVTIVDRSSGTDTHIRETGLEVNKPDIQELNSKLTGKLTEGDTVVFAGSTPPGFPIEDLKKMLEACTSAGATVCLDAGGDVLRSCAEHADLIKPNTSELAEMLGSTENNVPELISALRKVRSEPSLVTCGKEGAYYTDADRCLHASADTEGLTPVNSVGCGDAFLAGYLHASETGRSAEDALRLAVSCGTACILSPTTAIENAETVREIAQRVTCRMLD